MQKEPTTAAKSEWDADAKLIQRSARRRSPIGLWGNKVAAEKALVWGISRAGIDPNRRKIVLQLGRLIDANQAGNSRRSPAARRLASAAEQVLELLQEGEPNVDDAAYLVAWGYALPELAPLLDRDRWQHLVRGLLDFSREAVAADNAIVRQLLAGELPAILGWRLGGLPKRLKIGGLQTQARRGSKILAAWVTDHETLQSDGLTEQGRAATLCCAIALRGAGLVEKIQQKRVRAKQLDGIWLLAGAALGLQRADGSPVFSLQTFKSSELKDDRTLWPAIAKRVRDGNSIVATADLLQSKSSRSARSLAETVDLPDTGLADEDAKLAIMRPAWHHRFGRTVVDYHDDRVRIEFGSGKQELLTGRWDCHVTVDDEEVHAEGEIEQSCWYSDDDVHYLELEQTLSGNVTLQRQILVAREDQWSLIADAVIAPAEKEVRYEGRLPLAAGITATPEKETREWLLADAKVRAVVIPLAFPEWKTQRAAGTLDLQRDGDFAALRMQTSGIRRLYAPLFIDWGPRRWKAPRTWRQLTVAEDMEICDASRAHAFRIQIGPQQWAIYRALRFGRRTFLGQNTISDFYGGRFDPDDGTLDEMITVEEDSE